MICAATLVELVVLDQFLLTTFVVATSWALLSTAFGRAKSSLRAIRDVIA
ncbi:MAG: hypothetical protein P8R42_04980 [Candidatus Binatia bacterium]|nr:hypothetical protein [Candidatus Binatia bacterium]